MKRFCRKHCFVLFIAVLFLFMFTGCDSSLNESKTVGYVRFADEFEVSRGLSEKNTLMYPVDSLYWAYTAQKVDGLYTEGESEVLGTSGDTGSDGIKAGGYKLRPVKQGPATGLRDAEVGPFATGDWVFKVYGYLNYKVESGVGKFDGLVYTGATATLNNVSKVVKVDSGTGEPVVFELTDVSTTTVIPDTGEIGFEALKLTVPEDMRFFGTSEIKVKVFDVTSGATLIATSTTTMSADKNPTDASPVALNNMVFKTDTSNVLNSGVHILRIVAEYHDSYTEAKKTGLFTAYEGYKYTGSSYENILDDGYALVGEITDKKVDIRKGVKTVLYGDVNDIADSTEDTSEGEIGLYVAKILKAGKSTGSTSDADYDFYTSIPEAAAKYVSNPIILIRDVSFGGVVDKSVTIEPNGYFIKTLNVKGESKTVTISLGTNRTYEFASGTVIDLFRYSGTTVDLNTTGGTVTVNTTDSVWHTGSIGTLNITNVANTKASDLGYHLWAKVTSELKITKGYVDLGENITVAKLSLGTVAAADSVVLHGRLTTNVSNIDLIRDGKFESGGTAFTANQKTAFKTVTLNVNGGTTGSNVTLYGIDGMYMNLPAFAAARTDATYGNPIFKKSVTVSSAAVNLAFLHWNTKAAPTDTVPGVNFADKAKVIMGVDPADRKTVMNNIVLYALWSSPVGGTIYFVDSVYNGGSYTFYDSTGAVMATYTNTPPKPSDLTNAKSYSVYGKIAGAPDIFYVKGEKYASAVMFATVNGTDTERNGECTLSSGLTVGVEVYNSVQAVSGRARITGLIGSKLYGGKVQSEYFMNIGEVATKLGKSGNSWSDAHLKNGSGTVWNALNSLRTSVYNGCKDWFVPSFTEMVELVKTETTWVTSGHGYVCSSLCLWGSSVSCCAAVWPGENGFGGYMTNNDYSFIPVRSF